MVATIRAGTEWSSRMASRDTPRCAMTPPSGRPSVDTILLVPGAIHGSSTVPQENGRQFPDRS